MGKRGPRPNPLRVIDGGKSEPAIRFSPGLPDPPAHLGPVAKQEWRRITSELSGAGVLQQVDAQALATYCTLVATIAHCEEVIQAEGLTYEATAKSGDVLTRPRPEVVIRRDSMRLLLQFSREFGLTPAARVGWTSKKPTDPETQRILEKYIG